MKYLPEIFVKAAAVIFGLFLLACQTDLCEQEEPAPKSDVPEENPGGIPDDFNSSNDTSAKVLAGGKTNQNTPFARKTYTLKGATTSDNYKYNGKVEGAKTEYDNRMRALMEPTKDFASYPKEAVSIMTASNVFSIFHKSLDPQGKLKHKKGSLACVINVKQRMVPER